jgi:hypothetical protein
MFRSFKKHALAVAALGMVCSAVLAQTYPAAPDKDAPVNFDSALGSHNNWYVSWGYSRQQYAPTDIHVSQPSLGNDFTVHQVAATDFPTGFKDTVHDLLALNLTSPQENLRLGRFMNPEQTFAIELSIDHSKYNTDVNQSALVTGTINNAPVNSNQVLDDQYFNYALHNGLNHVMVNAVWLHHLAGPVKKPGDLELISRVGAGILLPHAENTIFGNQVQVGPKNDKVCCSSGDWWQVNGWTAGVEVGVRYTIYKSIYLELTQKVAYGVLRNVPVYQGTADHKLWMSEQVFSTGFRF